MKNKITYALIAGLVLLILFTVFLPAQNHAQTESNTAETDQLDVSVTTVVLVIVVTALVVSGVIGYAWLIKKQ